MLKAVVRHVSAVRHRQADDSGFTLVEVVIALLILAALSAAVSVTLLDGLAVSKAGRQRVAAANLAAREIEIARNQFGSSDAGALTLAGSGTVANPNPLAASGTVVDGVHYSVSRSVQWLPTGNGASPCDGGALVNHPSLRVDVAVSWPNMKSTKPVISRTLLTPPKGLLGNVSLAYVAVKVVNAAGVGALSVPVNVAGPGGSFVQTTDDTGCAVFQVGAAGTYTVVTDVTGWVDQTGVQHGEKTVVAQVGQLARLATTYDRAATMSVELVTDPGYGAPAPLPAVNYTRPNVPLSTARVIVPSAGVTTQVTGLWPTEDGYSSWAGACTDSDPAGPPTSGSREAPVVIGPGQTATVQARLAPLDITVTEDVGGVVQPAGGATVTAVSEDCPGSVAERTLSLGTTDSNGVLKSSIPYGQWVLSVTHGGFSAVGDPFVPTATGPLAVDVSVVK